MPAVGEQRKSSSPAQPQGGAAGSEPSRNQGRPYVWVSSSYFAEGFPYTIVNNLAEILFKRLGASYGTIGLTALFHLWWNLKFLWGPLLDRYETKRRWILGIEVALAVVMVALAFVASTGQMLGVIAVLFAVMGALSATHDIAIDGFYLEALDERGQSRFVGYRAMAYRVASLLVSGPSIVLIGLIGWTAGLAAMAVLMVALLVIHSFVLPRCETKQRPIGSLVSGALRLRVLLPGALVAAVIVGERELVILRPAWQKVRESIADTPLLGDLDLGGWIAIGLLLGLVVALLVPRRDIAAKDQTESHYAAAYVSFLQQPKVGRILAFVALFRTGESFLMKMKWPFLEDALDMQLVEYGLANGTLGLIASIAATLLGGWLISRDGLRRWIWPFVIAQNLLNLLYVGLALAAPNAGFVAITAVITLERLGEGLGTAVFMVYLMRCCDAAHKAAHMAIVTALMSVGFTVAGVASGFLAEALGFVNYFSLSFLATIPAMVLIFFLPHLDGRETTASSAGQQP